MSATRSWVYVLLAGAGMGLLIGWRAWSESSAVSGPQVSGSEQSQEAASPRLPTVSGLSKIERVGIPGATGEQTEAASIVPAPDVLEMASRGRRGQAACFKIRNSEFQSEYFVPIAMDCVADLLIAAGRFEVLEPYAKVPQPLGRELCIVRTTSERGTLLLRPSAEEFQVLYEIAELSASKEAIYRASTLQRLLDLCMRADALPQNKL